MKNTHFLQKLFSSGNLKINTFSGFQTGTDRVGLSGGLTFGQLSFSGNQIVTTRF